MCFDTVSLIVLRGESNVVAGFLHKVVGSIPSNPQSQVWLNQALNHYKITV